MPVQSEPVASSKRAEAFLLAADSARVGFYRCDLTTGEIDCTDTCKRNVGASGEVLLTIDRLRKLIDARDLPLFDDSIMRCISTRGEFAAEYRVSDDHGGSRWIAARGRFVSDDGGDAIVGATIDITDRHEAEAKLKAQQDLNSLITRNVAEGICFIDERGLATYINPAAEEILGWSLGEVQGKLLHDIAHYKRADGSIFPMSECPLGRTLTDGVAVRNIEDLWVHKSGELIPVLASSVPIQRDGRTVGSVVSIHDIRERKKMEIALREASRAKDEFLATVSHELRTPMTSVLGWIGYLKISGVPTEIEEVIRHIEASAKAQAAIVDDLLDVSRAVTGKLKLEIANVDLGEVVQRSLQTVALSATAKRIRADINDAGGAVVSGDAVRLEQVETNLLSNAIKFTPEGGEVRIDIRRDGTHVLVIVSDSGIGIDAELLPVVFDRFFQAPGYAAGGMGLGLAIVKQLVELHGGTVSVTSGGAECGSTFTVSLPSASV